MKKKLTNSVDYWDLKWKHYFEKYQADLRHAHYINSLIGNVGSFLEIGAGSFRDCNYLFNIGYDITGIDFSNFSVEQARKNFPLFSDRILQSNAFETTFSDFNFDVSYHNGFFSLFNDQQIKNLIQEQIRITKKIISCTVHNAHNKEFFKYFDELSKKDSLYNIRFFEQDEILEIMLPYCSDVKIYPVGRGKKQHEDYLIKLGITNPFIIRNYIKNFSKNKINTSERLLCIGKIK
jgi:hypothetical protein